jgi:hypothetical protein
MSSSSYDKRIPQRVYPWWLILVGFVFGVIATLIFTAPRWQPTVVYRYDDGDSSIWLQATALVHEATLTAEAPLNQRNMLPPPIDPILATATAYILEATAQAGAFNAASSITDPFALTATAIVAQATQAAQSSR